LGSLGYGAFDPRVRGIAMEWYGFFLVKIVWCDIWYYIWFYI
jgi:hypothetical protein